MGTISLERACGARRRRIVLGAAAPTCNVKFAMSYNDVIKRHINQSRRDV